MPKPLAPLINWNNPITKGLVFDTPFSEGGANPFDLISKQAQTLSSASWIKTVLGNSIDFSANAAAKLATTYAINNKQRTYEYLVYQTGNGGGGFGRIFEKRTGTPFEVIFENNGTGFELQITSTGTSYSFFWGHSLNTWAHFVVIYDSDNPGTLPIVYINGVSASVTTGGGSGTITTASDPYYIGGRASDNLRNFGGYIAYFRIYNRMLKQSEAKQLYSNPWQVYNIPTLQQQYNAPAAAVAASIANWKNLSGVGQA